MDLDQVCNPFFMKPGCEIFFVNGTEIASEKQINPRMTFKPPLPCTTPTHTAAFRVESKFEQKPYGRSKSLTI